MAVIYSWKRFWTGACGAAALLTLAGPSAFGQAAPPAAPLVLPADEPSRATVLITAIDHGNVPKVKAILKLDPGVANTLGVAGHEPLISALQQQNQEIVTLLLASGADVAKPDSQGNLPLYAALDSGQADLVRPLLAKGADVNTLDASQTPALFKAIGTGQVDLVRLLVEHGASLTATNPSGNTPLSAALVGDAHGSSAVVKYLISKGAKAPAALADGRTPLDVALDTGNAESSLPALLDGVKDVNALDANGLSLLHRAGERNYFEFAQRLLSRGAAVDVRSAAGETPLQTAVGTGNQAMAAFLLDHKADPDVRSGRGETSLAMLMRGAYVPDGVAYANRQDRGEFLRRVGGGNGALALARLLLAHGAHADVPDQFGLTPLHYALLNHNAPALALMPHAQPAPFLGLLLAISANQSATVAARIKAHPEQAYTRLSTGATALDVAALWGATGSATALLQAGADVNARDAYAQTPLGLAAHVPGNAPIVKFLVAHGASVGARDYRDATPLHLAVMANDLDTVRTLLAAKSDVNARSRSIGPPLSCVPKADGGEVASALLAAGADPNAPGEYRLTPLVAALANQNTPLVTLLIAHGANVNRRVDNERPPLMKALSERDLDDAKVLIAGGADVTASQFGETVLSVANDTGDAEIVSLVKAKLAEARAAHRPPPAGQ